MIIITIMINLQLNCTEGYRVIVTPAKSSISKILHPCTRPLPPTGVTSPLSMVANKSSPVILMMKKLANV